MSTIKALLRALNWFLGRLDRRRQRKSDEHAQAERNAVESDSYDWFAEHFNSDGMSDNASRTNNRDASEAERDD